MIKRCAIAFLILWVVLMLMLDPPRQMSEAEWRAEQMKWGLP